MNVDGKQKKWLSSDVMLVLVGAAVVVTVLSKCDTDSGCRYTYRSQSDCESDWGYGVCRQHGGQYYSPEQQQCDTSYGGGSGGGAYGGGGGYGDGAGGKGAHATGIERGGFGGSARGFGGG